jgi:hypothetical protein
MPKTAVTFKPKQVTKKILSPLKDRAFDVVVSRFGLGNESDRKTLEAIGEIYGITRERVRQIENAALLAVRKSDAYKSEQASFDELHTIIRELGGIVSEEELLKTLAKDEATQNHIHFYLVLGDAFTKHKEDEHFSSRWSVDDDVTKTVHTSLKSLYENLTDDEIVPESELISRFLGHLKDLSDEYKNDEIAKRYLSLSKKVSRNPLGEWGKADSSGVKTRGIKDYAFLMMRKHGSPMHFREVAKAICDTFGKKTHIATCHNELIKDGRFVLVGRGIYALSEWGYKSGVVRDVIKDILKANGPLTKEDVVEKVLKERYLKKNTILVNLQNAKYFKKQKDGNYVAV